MGKSFSVLVTLVGGIAVLVGGVLWWIGPNLASLAFYDSNRGQPYLVAEFVSGAADQLQPRYLQPLRQLVLSEGGVPRPALQLRHVANGRSADEWQHVLFYRIPQAQDVAQVMTSSPYGLLQDLTEGLRGMRLGSYTLSEIDTWQPALVICLVVDRENTQVDPLAPLLAGVAVHGGRILLNAELDVLNSAARWQRMVLIDFAGVDEALAWLGQPQVVTERDVVNSAAREFSLLLYEQPATGG